MSPRPSFSSPFGERARDGKRGGPLVSRGLGRRRRPAAAGAAGAARRRTALARGRRRARGGRRRARRRAGAAELERERAADPYASHMLGILRSLCSI